MIGQKGLPKPMEANEKKIPQPDTNVDKCHVQERHTADTTMILVPFYPPFLASTPIIFEKKKY